ncbi:hypothetical protein GJAV_G00217900 [Gymnothorax javanicus]|nr:hypothetical protein GJAV_G00217900 [Gymnothorax javanicus]
MVTLDVSLLFLLAIALMCLTESRSVPCRAEINQLEEVRVQTSARTTTLPCYITHRCRSGTPYVRWFVFGRDAHRKIQTQTAKYSMNGQNLTIHFLRANDSGVYYCAVFSSKIVPSIGNGTRLVVRGRPNNTTTKQALLWTLFAVLAVYSALILMLLVSKKARREIFRSKRSSTERGSTRRQHFHAVVQELYSQGNLPSTGRNSNYANQRRSP